MGEKYCIVNVDGLTPDQKEVFESLRDYITDRNDRSIYVVKGWAGTGKTYSVGIFIRYLLEVMYPTRKWFKIAMTGPTNKSVRVIKKTMGLKEKRITYQTIHKLLGLKEKITIEGKQEFVNDGVFVPPINSTKVLVIDEVSMLNDELFNMIIAYRDKIKIICMGDPAQIPPVGKVDCIPFREELYDFYDIKTLNLRTIMRQKMENPIISSSVLIRKNLSSSEIPMKYETNVNEKGEGIEFLNLNKFEDRKSFTDKLEKYLKDKEFKKNPEYLKIIAWRNKTVSHMNDVSRRIIYGDLSYESKILENEKLIANNPIIQGEQIVFNTNDEFKVKDYKIIRDKFRIDGIECDFKIYETTVISLDEDDQEFEVDIEILHEESEHQFKETADSLKKRAIEQKGKNKSWLKYYEFLRRYSDVGYGYAITAHKSQGSTYNYTFVLEDDIDTNYNTVERNRIKYTSYTRSSKKLYVLRRF